MSNFTPKISFIIPVFNTEKYLPACIESILSLEISKEIILIDDGSSDHSLSIALNYRQQYDFITVISGANKGQSSARNQGLKIAKGEYIYFVDSDDYLLNIDLAKIIDFAESHQVDIIKFQAQQTIENRPNFVHFIPSAFAAIQNGDNILATGYQTLMAMSKNWIPGVCWTLIKRRLIEQYQLYFYEHLRAEDQLFYIQLLTLAKNIQVLEVSDIFYNYHIRPNSTVSAPNTQYFLDHFSIGDLILQWSQQKAFDPTMMNAINIILSRIFQSALGIFQQFSDEQKQQTQHHITPALLNFINHHLGTNYALK